jgi:hypothetical protein
MLQNGSNRKEREREGGRERGGGDCRIDLHGIFSIHHTEKYGTKMKQYNLKHKLRETVHLTL